MRTARALAALAGALAVCAIPSAAAAQAPPPDSQFQKVAIDQTPGEPIDLAVLPDGRVLHTERSGEVWLHDPDTGLKTLAAKLDVYSARRGGPAEHRARPELRGERLDLPLLLAAAEHAGRRPGDADGQRGRRAGVRHAGGLRRRSRATSSSRASSGPATRSTSAPSRRSSRSRSTAASAATSAATSSSTSNGNLLLSTGDDTNPFQSDGYAPIDERANRNPAFDAQRTAANTNDLRGKVLRITSTRTAATRSRRATCSSTTATR